MRLMTLMTALLVVLAPVSVTAQSQFSAVISVDDKVITSFELSQRRKLLELFRTPGNLDQVAREQLIEDRLKQGELDRVGLRLSDEVLNRELEAFAGRANLTLDQFTNVLNQNGVEFTTFETFVLMGVSWRDYVRERYTRQVRITEADIDRAAAGAGGSADGIEVLLSEIIIPAPPPRAAQAQAIASQIAQTTSTDVFSRAARQYSALPSKARGGRLDWLPLSNYPPQLRGLITGLGRGEVTAPIGIPNGVALFQMRGIREGRIARPTPTEIDYAAFYLPGGLTDAGLQAARTLELRTDTCDDLYGAARGLPAEVLDRTPRSPADIPQDIAIRLANLDIGEADYSLTRNDGNTLVFLMMCGRTTADGTTDRDALRNQLRSQRLAGFADGLLAELRAAAKIRG